MRQEMRFESGILRVVASGPFSLEEAQRAFLEILEAAERHQAGKILVDGRTLTGNPEVMERFIYGKFAADESRSFARERDMPRVPRFAYVLNVPVRDPGKFGENVATNRGMILKVCETAEEAVEWLGPSAGGGKTPAGGA
jgi:hypothetical protein